MARSLTIAQRLGLGFGLILLLFTIVTVLGIQRVSVMDQTLNTVNQGATQKQRFAINFRGSVHDRAIAIRDAVLVERDSELRRHLQSVRELDAFYQDSAQQMDELFERQPVTDQERRLLTRIQDIEQRTLALTQDLVDVRTQASTREIREMIGTLQSGAGEAVDVMETSHHLAQKTVEKTREAESALSTIRQEVVSITDMNHQIASAAEEQSQVAEGVNQNINRISEATLASSAGADQVAGSSRDLADLAQQLSRKVAHFEV